MNSTKYNVNLCVLSYCLFHSNFYILKMEDSVSTRFKRLKIQKNHRILYFCVV